MSTTLSRNEVLRGLDSQHRAYLAPSWDGPITELTRMELHHRIEALGAHIGCLSTNYSSADNTWSANPTFTADAEPWIKARLECLQRHEGLDAEAEKETPR